MNYITYLCSGVFTNVEDVEIINQVVLLGKKVIEDDEWNQGFVKFDDLKTFIENHSVNQDNDENMITNKITFEESEFDVLFLKEEFYMDVDNIPILQETKYIFVISGYTFNL